MQPTINIFKEAILVQDAVNVTAIVGAWHRARIELSTADGEDKKRFLDALYMSKLSSLLTFDTDCIGSVRFDGEDLFREAYQYARTLTEED